MKTILVPLDGSILAEQVLPYVYALAPLLDARICLLRAVADSEHGGLLAETIAGTYFVGEPLAAQQARQTRSLDLLWRNAERYLESHAARLHEAGLDATIEVRCGPAADVIAETALEQRVALIALASHGYSGMKRWALGSVTDKVVQTTSTPVLIVRGAKEPPATKVAIRRMLLPLDGSALARQALPLASMLARSARAELLLLHAVAPAIEAAPNFPARGQLIPRYGEVLAALRHQAASELERLAGELRAHKVAVRTRVVNGHAAEALLDEAAQGEVDLIVMATHGYSGMKRWALGSVADKALHATATPLILVRARL